MTKKEKKETKEKEKKETKEKSFLKKFEKKMVSKKILKPSKMTVVVKEYKAPSVLNDPNRFFKNEWEEAKKAMFFK